MKNWIGIAFVLFVLYCILSSGRESYANWGNRFGPHLPVYSDYSLLLPHPSYEVSDPPDFSLRDEKHKVQRHMNDPPNVLSYTAANQNYKNGLCLKGEGGPDLYRPCMKPYQFFWVKNRAGDPMYYNSLLKLPTLQRPFTAAVGIRYDVNHPALV